MRYGRSYGVERSVREGMRERMRRSRDSYSDDIESGAEYTDEHLYEDNVDQFTGSYSGNTQIQSVSSRGMRIPNGMQISLPVHNLNKKPLTVQRFLFWIVLAVEIYVLVSIISVMITSVKVVNMYDKISGQSVSGSFNKKLAFVSALVNATGNADYALSIGFTKEEAEQMLESNAFRTGYTDPVTGDPMNTPTSGSTITPWSSSNWSEAVATHNMNYESTGTILKTDGWSYESGSGFLKQSQSSGSYWSSAGTSGNTLKDYGCLWFSLATIVTNVTGEVYGVENLLADVGYSISFVNGKWKVTPNIGKVGVYPSYMHPGGTGDVPATAKDILSKCTAGISVSNNLDFDELENATFDNGELYLVHIQNDTSHNMAAAPANEHWFIIYGKDNTNFFIANGAGNAKTSGVGSIEYAEGKLNHIYKVVKQ